MKHFSFPLILSGCAAVCVLAESPPEIPLPPPPADAAPVAELKLVDPAGLRLPWHTTDLYWKGVATNDLQSVSVTFHVDKDVPDTCNLYIAPMGGQHLNKIMFYGGIQSNVNGWPSPDEPRRVHPGPGIIFSRWGGEPVDIKAARPEPGGLCESAGYEGHFVSVRKPYRWRAGTYTWEVRKLETETVNGHTHTWFGCFLKDHQTGEVIKTGALQFEGETFAFNGHSTSFVEIYATSKIPRSPVPEVTVVFEPTVVNGMRSPLTPVGVYHPRKGSQGAASPPLGRATAVEKGVQVELRNVPFEGEAIPESRYQLTW